MFRDILEEHLNFMNTQEYYDYVKDIRPETKDEAFRYYSDAVTGIANGISKIEFPNKKTDISIETIGDRTGNAVSILDILTAEFFLDICDDRTFELWGKTKPKNIKEIVDNAFRKFDCYKWSGNYDFETVPRASLFLISECVRLYAMELWKSL